MKMAIFTDTFHPNVDGITIVLKNVVRLLKGKGNEVKIYCPGSLETKRNNTDNGIEYNLSLSVPVYPQYRLSLFPFLHFMNFKSEKFDVIHSHGIAAEGLTAILFSKLFKIPSIVTYHTNMDFLSHYISLGNNSIDLIMKKMIMGYTAWYLNQFDLVTVPSKNTQKKLKEYGLNSVVIPTFINGSIFTPSGKKPKKEFKILSVGRIIKEKNFETLMLAFKKLREQFPEAEFTIVGEGPAEKYYKEFAEQKDVDVNFIGVVENEKLPELYRKADVFALSSVFETQGLVALESIACGTPVVGIKNTSLGEIVSSGKNGYLAENTPDDIADKIVKAKSIPRHKIHQTVKEATDEQIYYSNLMKIYGDLIESRKH
ncbi:MAG: hypothetical protein CL943_03385 [Candidatus Diapherotrites archaeon]|uniref:Glycosyltransferase family 4 protein n=1 Tax=Candidatus Iainarchaeum sp. TaxID=3101447 RepID=A0A2D6M1N1_9ARCH|nr:hypothetical protein [Candidatus Diapherotrites archaeon]|tara:strand:- start:3401 stop:4513 length:1113 start_codon:yes stop_codon:yes gene_type:complete